MPHSVAREKIIDLLYVYSQMRIDVCERIAGEIIKELQKDGFKIIQEGKAND